MKAVKVLFIYAMLLSLLGGTFETSMGKEGEEIVSKPSKLLIIWTSGDPEVAVNMVFMYTNASKKHGWWDEVALLIWGPSQVLAAHDYDVQQKIREMKKNGVTLLACKACSDKYDVSERLERLGIGVKYVGEDLTAMLKNGWTSLTF